MQARDIRLDFYRGLAMFIILMAHTPHNPFTLWIPARFGFSDATEIFVFCSGMASSIAFGKVFAERGWAMGAARIGYRVWQVYWAHICLFFAVAATVSTLNATGLFARDYVGQLNLYPFFKNAQTMLPSLLTLRYVPNYFDILPMYLAILAMVPLVMALSRLSLWLVAGLVLALWMGAQLQWLELPAEPWSARPWFFNPFGWQLVFFTGFALMRGWIPAPPVNRRLIVLAAVVVVVIVPLAYFRIIREVDAIRHWRSEYNYLIWKSDFGILRYVHFLALAYLAWVVAGPGGARLKADPRGRIGEAWQMVLSWILKVGQQSLAVFVFSMWLARLLGLTLDLAGHTTLAVWAVNIFGLGALVVLAHVTGWFKAHPWRKAGV